MTNAERFISLYKELEDALEARFRAQGKSASNPVHQYLGEVESEPVRDKLDLCRQVRNLITHSADMGGHPPVQPSDELLAALEQSYEYISRPPLALKRATPAAKLMRAVESDRVAWLMKRMTEKGFSHAPVMEGARLIGVFSATTPFSLYLAGRGLHEQMRVSEIMDVLRPQAHLTERFIFVDPALTTVEASRLFVRSSRYEKRVAALFITEDGTPDAPLLGMLTPWDIVGERTATEDFEPEKSSISSVSTTEE